MDGFFVSNDAGSGIIDDRIQAPSESRKRSGFADI